MRRMTSDTSHDRGAVAIFVALCLVILLMIAAWVIDGSALYQERRELQNGADAAALAIARDCAEGACGDVYATGEAFADGNAGDGQSRIVSGGITFPDSNSVRVVVRTQDAGSNVDGDATTVDRGEPVVDGGSGVRSSRVRFR